MKFLHTISPLCFAVLAIKPIAVAQKAGDVIYQKGFLSIEEAHKSIQLPEGYRLELILSEPEIDEPVMCAWDGNGAMYVVQMNTYMQDADATGEREPTSRITRHVDTNGDGVYDKHSTYADNLLLPRFVLPLDDRVIVGVTNTLDLWTYRDTTGNGVADEVIKIFEGGKRKGNMEHQPSGLMWALDNWLYLTYEPVRYRFTDGEFKVETLPKGNGQWGLSQDNWGRLYYSRAGGEVAAAGFQQPPVYGQLQLDDEIEKNFNRVYPIAQVPDVQGGNGRVGKNGGVNGFTGVSGQSIFRGDRLPEEMHNRLLIPEPVGRLIRRAVVNRADAKTIISNADPESEFIRTRDINFRPVWTATTPGGQLAIVDMHRGIIQQGSWTKPGSYLRGIIDKWGLAENIGKGRIYRLVHEDFEAGPQPKMLDESTAELVKHLSHPNGWWRDTAQKLIILRKDRDSVVPTLEKVVTEGNSDLGRLHALWTLEGIGKLSPGVVAAALKDKASIVRTSAIRVAEPFMGSENPTVIAAFQGEFPDDMEMVAQYLNSLPASRTSNPDLLALGVKLSKEYGDKDIVQAVQKARKAAAKQELFLAAQKSQGEGFGESMQRGQVIYDQLCFNCHGANGEGTPMAGKPGAKLAPPFIDSPHLQGSAANAIRIILHGLTSEGDDKKYQGLMVPMGANDDQWIADVTTYIRNSFGNKGPAISPLFVSQLRKKHINRTEPWTVQELEQIPPVAMPFNKDWKLSASHNERSVKLAFDGVPKTRYNSKESMEPGMWLQIEFPTKVKLAGLVLDSTAARRGGELMGYEVRVSDDGEKWSKPIASGGKSEQLLKIDFSPVDAKFIRITQTGEDKSSWATNEITIMAKN